MIRKFYQHITLLFILIWLTGQTGCIPGYTLENIVVTEDVIYRSGEKVRLTGRILEMDGNVDDHGFHIDKSESFASPVIVSLGPKTNGLGRFIGGYELLDIDTKYYFRSYANINGNEITGQTKKFFTSKSRIEYFHPANGIEGQLLTIVGKNFTHDTQVLFNGKGVEIISINNETTIELRIPPLEDSAEAIISLLVQDTTMVFTEPFAYHFGHWNLETTFIDNMLLYETMWLKNDNEFVFGLGADNKRNLNLNIWSLNLISYEWTNLNFSGKSPSRSPFNSNGYWGGGAVKFDKLTGPQFSPFFWEYSAGTFVMKHFLNFALYKSVGLQLNGELYVFGGNLVNSSSNSSIFRFKELTDSWDIVAESPIEILGNNPYFSYNNEAYFLQPDGSIWKYNPTDNTWRISGYYPGLIKEYGAAVVLNDNIYIGLFANSKQIWEWNITSNEWKQKIGFKGDIRDINIGYFTHNNKVYFFRTKFNGGSYVTDPRMELWSLDPTQLK